MRQACDVCLRTVRAVAYHLPVHAHAWLVWVQLALCLVAWLHALAHLEERHLVVRVHLVTQDAVCSQIVWLMQVGAGCHTEATHSLTAAHDSWSALTFQWRWLVDGTSE